MPAFLAGLGSEEMAPVAGLALTGKSRLQIVSSFHCLLIVSMVSRMNYFIRI